jgi:prepilin-type processing-associated H-X9-DG protein
MIKLKQAFNPSYMIFLGDAKTMSLRATKWCWEKDYAPIHSDKANYLTIDGSVKTLGKNELGLSFFSGEKEWKGWKLDKKRWSNIK